MGLHYIRFLKAPKITQDPKGTHHVTCLHTITTDLGESFYPRDTEVKVMVSRSLTIFEQAYFGGKTTMLQQQQLQWRAGMRQLAVDVILPREALVDDASVTMTVGPESCSESPRLWINHGVGCNGTGSDRGEPTLIMPSILGSSTTLTIYQPRKGFPMPVRLVRPLPLLTSPGVVAIREASSANIAIAQHVWDAGVALIPTLDRCLNHPSPVRVLPALKAALTCSVSPRIVEMGCGCAPVGCAVSQLLPEAQVVVTDLEEARELAEENVGERPSLTPMSGEQSLRFVALDWTEECVPPELVGTGWDILIASDCTYNPDYGPALVGTMGRLLEHSPKALVVVAMKQRHASEVSFFELMKAADFIVVEREQVLAPLEDSEVESEETEKIDIFVFGKQRNST